MELDIDVCRSIAVQHGLPLQFVIKEFHVFSVLAQVARFTSETGGKPVFKGGTALSKVYLENAQRFSEDLDFDLDENVEGVRAFSKELAGSLEGYSITEFRRVHGTIQFYCNYETPLGGKDHVRVDIAAKKIITSVPPAMKTAASEFTRASLFGIYVYSLEDLVARKMCALADRAEGKDVYDVYAGLPLCKGMGKAIERMLESEGKSGSNSAFVKKVIERLGKTDPAKLRNLTNPFIPLKYRPKDWLELKNDLIIRLETMEV